MDTTLMAFFLLVQSAILNIYIIKEYRNRMFVYFWFLADFVCFFAILCTVIIAYKYLTASEDVSVEQREYRYSPKHVLGSKFPTSKLGILPLGYISWFFYSIILFCKIMTIFRSEMPNKLRDEPFGPQFLQVTIGTWGIIFILLAEGHNWAPRGSPRHIYVTSLWAKTGIDILDSTILMSLLLGNDTQRMLTLTLKTQIILLSSFSFFLPTFALYKLSFPNRISGHFSLQLKIVNSLLYLCLIDIPYLAVRLYLLFRYGYIGSVFLLKNVLAIVILLLWIYQDFHELVRRRYFFEEYHQTGSNGIYLTQPRVAL
jgi:hypothetical protein